MARHINSRERGKKNESGEGNHPPPQNHKRRMNKQSYREVLGERLKSFRIDQGLSLYRIARDGGINLHQAGAVERGLTNYTIDALLGYIVGCGLYMYFATKSEERVKPHDFSDLVVKGLLNDPAK